MNRIILLSVFLCLVNNIIGQDGYKVKRDSLQSVVLKQTRMLDIYLPDGYDAPNAKFPVIFVLDGESRCQHIVPTARFLFLNEKMPKAIIVGVINIERTYDFLQTSIEDSKFGGGADNFIKFFKNELIPYIDGNLKTEQYKVLIGHSYGGAFAFYSFINEPDIFDAYMCIDPSFWYNNQALVKNAHDGFVPTKNWNKPLFIAGRDIKAQNYLGIAQMHEELKKTAPESLNWKMVSYPDENHNSITMKGVYDGLRFIFDNNDYFKIVPNSGIIPNGVSYYAYIENGNPRLRYTIDGSEPTLSSPLCNDTIKLNKPCTLTVKQVSAKYRKTKPETRIFAEGDFIKGQQSVKKIKQGLKYSYYEGAWDTIPDLTNIVPIKTGVSDIINLNIALKNECFAIQFEGYLYISKKDLYYFYNESDDGAKVYFNNQLLVNSNELYSPFKPVFTKYIPLEQGYYPIKIQYFQRIENKFLTFKYSIGGNKLKQFTKDFFYHLE